MTSLIILLIFGNTLVPYTLAGNSSQAPDFQVSALSKNSNPNAWGVFIAAPVGHHFNLQAPIQAELINRKKNRILFRVTEKTKGKISFEVSDPDIVVDSPATVTAYLCDDPNTYCIKKTRSFKIGDPKVLNATLAEWTVPSAAPTSSPVGSSPNQKNQSGFWDNQPTLAIEEARKLGLPLWIDFYGVWCPPCNLYDELIFSKPSFKKMSKGWVLLKIDADRESSWQLKSHFRVGGYPTFIFASVNPQGSPDARALTEIGRIVGFFPEPDLAKELKMILDQKTIVSDSDDPSFTHAIRRIHFYRDQEDWEQARDWIRKAKDRLPKGDGASIANLQLEILSADDSIREKSDTRDPSRDWLSSDSHASLIKKVRESQKKLDSDSLVLLIYLMMDTASLAPPQNPKSAPLSLAEAQTIRTSVTEWLEELSHRVRSQTLFVPGSELSIFDLEAFRADLGVVLGDDVLLKSSRENGIKALKKLMQRYQNRDSRGWQLELAYLYRVTGKTAEAKKIYQSLVKRFPEEFTFHFAFSKFYFDLNDFESARGHAEKAKKFSYGDNRIRSTERLAWVMAKQGEIKPAIKMIDLFLKEQTVPEKSLKVRTNRYLKGLSDLRDKLAKGDLE